MALVFRSASAATSHRPGPMHERTAAHTRGAKREDLDYPELGSSRPRVRSEFPATTRTGGQVHHHVLGEPRPGPLFRINAGGGGRFGRIRSRNAVSLCRVGAPFARGRG